MVKKKPDQPSASQPEPTKPRRAETARPAAGAEELNEAKKIAAGKPGKNDKTGVTAAPEEIVPAVTVADSKPARSLKASKSAKTAKADTPKVPVAPPVLYHHSLMTEDDIYLFNEGSHFNLHNKLGSQTMQVDGQWGTHFAVWAPNAEAVFVTGSFNDWDKESHPLLPRESSGIWEGFVPGVGKGAHYKYFIRSRYHGYCVEKADPYGVFGEIPPRTASIVWDTYYEWGDREWMNTRHCANGLDSPIAIYEVHLGSWRHNPGEMNQSFSYRELASSLVDYVKDLGYTHVEFMPVMEHPFYASWGYQVTGFFAPTSRYGSPQDFMYLIDKLHQAGIGVILDWVPSHFPTDDIGLSYFDGTHLFEHADPRQGYHPDWGSYIFNYGRNEVRNFLISSALFWLEKYHVDGLRVDAVASMLYLDYSRKEGEWIPNEFGGRENLPAVSFLRRLNEEIYRQFPDTQMIAEESTAWPMVSRPTYLGGLGFGLKWDMGWMHDTLVYFSKDPIYRRFHHNSLTFRMLYAFTENFVLSLSHDEVVHGKGSLLRKMPGDDWQKFANLRLLFADMYGQPGKKLMFMGCEFGQWDEWKHDHSLDWHLLDVDPHRKMLNWVRDLNRVYREEAALHEHDLNMSGFEWLDCNDADGSTLSFLRWSKTPPNEVILVVMNFTPVPRENYRVGLPRAGFWRELLNSDAELYGGSGVGNAGGCHSEPIEHHGRPQSMNILLPPLSALFFKAQG
jgi:1,4-alpha-glucan branching enzyme